MIQIAGCRRAEELATSECGGGGSCPGIFLTEDGKVLIQGNRLSEATKSGLRIGPDEEAVELPLQVLREALTNLK